MNAELFTGGTLLSPEQQMKMNEFHGKEDQKWVLIYKATRDGFGGGDFHRFCDNQGPTMSVIQSNDGGYLFGGYTSVSWRSAETFVIDKHGPFIFTLTNPHGIPPCKYPIQDAEYSILDKSVCGPTFGRGADLHVYGNSHTHSDSNFNFPCSYTDKTKRGSMTFTGTKNFRTSDIEVYRLMTN
jgi:hypothetical protein